MLRLNAKLGLGCRFVLTGDVLQLPPVQVTRSLLLVVSPVNCLYSSCSARLQDSGRADGPLGFFFLNDCIVAALQPRVILFPDTGEPNYRITDPRLAELAYHVRYGKVGKGGAKRSL